MISNIKYLVGDKKFSSETLEPFSQQVCNFLSKFSNELNKTKNIRNFPDIKTLAFWCRERNILNLKRKYNASNNLIGLGLVFHVTPSNIPTNFASSKIAFPIIPNTLPTPFIKSLLKNSCIFSIIIEAISRGDFFKLLDNTKHMFVEKSPWLIIFGLSITIIDESV